jgi:hypothetical protein
MANEHPTQSTPSPVVNRVRSEEFRDVYANGSLVALSPYDVTLIFMKTTDYAGHTMQVDQVSVAMSPQHFKALVNSLNETLTGYERAFGTLNIPDSDVQPAFVASDIEKRIEILRDQNREQKKAMASSTETKPPAKQSPGAVRKKGH